ncbi:MAG TPA: tetratricopeptide repeat protein [Thermoanaerobaculia bacterium]|nr:tetratricopeptide repeat protein [Thermoanaerobaculia bacterium]
MSPEPVPPATQHAEVFGRNNVIVQIQGDHNKVTPIAELPHLTLTRYLTRRRGGDRPSGEAAEILSPYALAIPFIGRESVMADLWTWMEKDQPVSVRVLTARGGGGKTRLALELCEEATRKGWFAGFVTDRELQRFLAQQNLSTWGWNRPTLVVIDYAASRARLLHDWLVELADNAGDSGHPLRLLLLERHADPSMGWWLEAFGRGGGDADAVRRFLDPAGRPFTLPTFGASERRAIFGATLKQVGSGLEPPETPEFARRLAELSWGGEPLFLMMAGLTAARAGLAHILALSPTDVVFEVARHEIHRIWEIGRHRGIDGDFLAHMAAYVTLCQGLSRSQMEEAIEVEKRMLRYDSVGDPPRIYQVLHDALPGNGSDVAPVLPDILGEAVALSALGAGDPGKAEEAVLRAVASGRARVLPTLIRVADDFGSARKVALDWLARLVKEEGEEDEVLLQIVDELPHHTLALREAAVELTAVLVKRFRQREQKNDLARLLNNQSVRLSDLGRREEALKAGQESVAIRRELALAHPEAFRPGLAISLSNLSGRLSALGRREEALEVVQESVSIRRELASTSPEAFSGLAMSLNNSAVLLRDLGRREEALEAGQESVSLYRGLASARPEVFRTVLAMSLNNLPTLLIPLDRREEALEAVQEAVSLYRELASTHPEAYRPDVAHSLNNLAYSLNNLGHREEALETLQESVSLYRELASARPEAFRPDLAGLLFNLSFYLGEAGQNDRAVESCRDAIELLIPFFLTIPAAFGEWMAQIVGQYLDLVQEIGQKPDLDLLAPLVEFGFLEIETEDSTSSDEAASDPEKEP